MASHPLKIEREIRGWSQSRVAEALGVSTRTVLRWEQRLSVPSTRYQERLCLLFGKTAQELDLLTTENQEAPAAEQTAAATLPVTTQQAPLPASALTDPAIPVTLGREANLIGRADLLAQIKERLFSSQTLALTALNGLPGVGKTALAVSLCSDPEVLQHFADGILWAGLGPQPNRQSLLARWGSLLGLSPSEVENPTRWQDWARALQAAIGSRRMLLVIDDAWSAEDALAFRIGGKHCAHILTTRLPQVAFAFAQQETLVVPELEEADGLALLERFVPQLVLQEPESAVALVRQVGSLPLALTLIGKHLASQSLTGQPRRLRTALAHLQQTEQRLALSVPTTFLERPPHLPEHIPVSLQAAIAVSDQNLSEQAHKTLCALGVFPAKPNSFSEEAAAAVSQQGVEVLDELWDAGLLESSGPGRYTLHQAISDYARAQSQNTAIAYQQLVKYVLSYVQAHEQDYEALELETINILAALDTAAIQHLSHELIQIVLALTPFLRVRGLYSQGNHYLQQALQAITTIEDQRASVKLLSHLAEFAELRGDYAQAETYIQQGLALARQEQDLDRGCALLTTQGNLAIIHGDYKQARTSYEEGLVSAREAGKSELICMFLYSLGRVSNAQGEYRQAEAYSQEGLALARQEGLQELMMKLLASLGVMASKQDNFVQAEQYCQEGLALARQLGHREYQGYILNSLAGIVYDQGKYDQAETSFQEMLALTQQIGHRTLTSIALLNLGELAAQQGNYIAAQRYLLESLELVRHLGSRYQLPYLLRTLGYVTSQQGEYRQASTYLQESVELARHQGALHDLETALVTWGEIHLKYEQVEAAEAAFDEVLALNKEAEQHPQLVAQAKYGQAQILARRGEISKACRLGQESLATLERLKHFKADEVRQWLHSLAS
jgi:tetratricopeptide (TPR) repeat protein/transcriptional regulator with XRE-family HTH domain